MTDKLLNCCLLLGVLLCKKLLKYIFRFQVNFQKLNNVRGKNPNSGARLISAVKQEIPRFGSKFNEQRRTVMPCTSIESSTRDVYKANIPLTQCEIPDFDRGLRRMHLIR